MSNFTLKFYGMDELRESLNLNRIQRQVSLGVGVASRQVINEIKDQIKERYNVPGKLSIDPTIKSNQQAFGSKVIRQDITFIHEYTNLAKFPFSWEWGNIPPFPKRRKGKVHSAAIKRGQTRIVYGKYGYGGFTQLNGAYGLQMFERTSPARTPLRLVFGPSPAQMAEWMINYNPSVRKAIDNVELTIINLL